MKALFAVLRTNGRAWDKTNPVRSQQQWSEHAAFMDKSSAALTADSFWVLGGPLGEGVDFLLAIKADHEGWVRLTLQNDPCSRSGILEVKSIQSSDHPARFYWEGIIRSVESSILDSQFCIDL